MHASFQNNPIEILTENPPQVEQDGEKVIKTYPCLNFDPPRCYNLDVSKGKKINCFQDTVNFRTIGTVRHRPQLLLTSDYQILVPILQ